MARKNDKCGCGRTSDKHETHEHNHESVSGCASSGGAHTHNGAAKACGCAGGKPPPLKLSESAKLWISFFALLAGFAVGHWMLPLPLYPFTDPSWIAVFLCAYPIFAEAYETLVKERRISASLLIGTAISASILLQFVTYFTENNFEGNCAESYIFAAGEIAFLMALGEIIEARTVRKTRAGIEALLNLAPRKARRLLANGGNEEISADAICVGDILIVRPNDMMPADGLILEGVTSVDQSPMTGEHLPVDKTAGDQVLAGTWNKDGAIKIKALKAAKDASIAKLITLVEEAEGKKAPITKVANKWASYIVPTAIIASVAVFFIAKYALEISTIGALIRAVTILVVFCPCAFALATPTAIAAALGNAAKRGILVKSGASIEALARAKVVAFDKTGTLTDAKISVNAAIAFNPETENSLIAAAAAAEKYSEHPIAKAVLKRASALGISIKDAKNTRSLIGAGVECEIENSKILVAKWAHIKDLHGAQNADAKDFAAKAAASGASVIGVAKDGVLIGLISLSDNLREGSAKLVDFLKKMGIFTAMLSGDTIESAASVAKKAGIESVYADLSPEGKCEVAANLKREKGELCMIGDGVNDAPALAYADCSIAMAALGSDAAIEAADIALLSGDIKKLGGLFTLAKSTLSTIKANMALSLSVSFVAIVLSTFGILTPVSGAIWHNASSVLVVLNSARLLRKK